MIPFTTLARGLQILAFLALIIYLGVFLAVLVEPDLLSSTAQGRNWVDPMPYRFVGPLIFASLIFFAPGFLALCYVVQLFGRYAEGDCLSPYIIARIQGLARMLFLLALTNIFWGPSMDVLHALILSPEHGSIALGISNLQVVSVLGGGLLWAISRALDEGYRALSENRSFV